MARIFLAKALGVVDEVVVSPPVGNRTVSAADESLHRLATNAIRAQAHSVLVKSDNRCRSFLFPFPFDAYSIHLYTIIASGT